MERGKKGRFGPLVLVVFPGILYSECLKSTECSFAVTSPIPPETKAIQLLFDQNYNK